MGKSRRTSNNSNFNLKLEQNDYEELLQKMENTQLI